MRYLAIDHGTRRIGVAIGSTEDRIAAPVSVVPALPEDAALARLAALTAEYGAGELVVGLPLNMDDTEGPQALAARAFAARLAAATNVPVVLWDERLSSFSADQALAGQYTRKQKKARQDAVAAAAILQDFLLAPDDARNAAERVEAR